MSPNPSSPWPSLLKVALILGCTFTFCILGLVAGVLAAKVMLSASPGEGGEVLATVLTPPAVGAVFGFIVGLITASFVRWQSKPPPSSITNLPPRQNG